MSQPGSYSDMNIEKMIITLSFSILASTIGMMFYAALFGIIVYGQNVTANTTRANVAQPRANNDSSSLLADIIIEHAGGSFASLQTDADNKTWIATGNWDLVADPTNATRTN